MTRYTDTHSPDPPQTKTKHTTQKAKMIVCVAYHFSFLSCVFCFCLWGVGRVGVRVACHFSFLCYVFCFCLLALCVAYHFSFHTEN
jgi:hypothetical protein